MMRFFKLFRNRRLLIVVSIIVVLSACFLYLPKFNIARQKNLQRTFVKASAFPPSSLTKQKVFGMIDQYSNDSLNAYDLWIVNDSLYVAGCTTSLGHGVSYSPYWGSYYEYYYSIINDVTLMKWSSNGTLLWARTWGGAGEDTATAIWCNGSAIYTCGWTKSFGSSQKSMLVIRWDMDGNLLWNRTWTTNPADPIMGNAIWGSNDGIYVAGHKDGSTYNNEGKIYLVKWDLNGNFIWNRTCNSGYMAYGESLRIVNGSVILYASINSGNYSCYYHVPSEFPYPNYTYFLTKWNGNGDMIFNRTWGLAKRLGPSGDYSMFEHDGFLYTCEYQCCPSNSYFVKWDYSGNVQSNISLPIYEPIQIMKTNGTNIFLFHDQCSNITICDFAGNILANDDDLGFNYNSIAMACDRTNIFICSSGANEMFIQRFGFHYLPQASFACPDCALLNEPVEFLFTGDDGDGPASYIWDFSDGGKFYGQNATHIFNKTGNNYAILSVIDQDGDHAGASKWIPVYDRNEFGNIDFKTNCSYSIAGQFIKITFTGTTGSYYVQMCWDFGDGRRIFGLGYSSFYETWPDTTLRDKVATHEYTNPGIYTIELSLSSVCNISSKKQLSLQVLDPNQDEDKDGISNIFEYQYGTDPFRSDSDNDGFSDAAEIQWNTDPLNGFDNLNSRIIVLSVLSCITLIILCAVVKWKKSTSSNVSNLLAQQNINSIDTDTQSGIDGIVPTINSIRESTTWSQAFVPIILSVDAGNSNSVVSSSDKYHCRNSYNELPFTENYNVIRGPQASVFVPKISRTYIDPKLLNRENTTSCNLTNDENLQVNMFYYCPECKTRHLITVSSNHHELTCLKCGRNLIRLMKLKTVIMKMKSEFISK